MARSITSPSAAGTIVDKLKLYEGGTGQVTAAAALAAFGGIPLSSVNQPLGIAGLDMNKRISSDSLPVDLISTIGVQGSSDVVKGTTSIFKITNYDAFNVYDIVAISGQVVIVGETISYTAPTTVGAGGFILNGRTFSLQIVEFKPLKPTLVVNDVIGSDTLTAVLQAAGSAFSTGGGTATHTSTDWQLSTDVAFSSITQQSMADTLNKTSWNTNAVTVKTTYYLRCRYRDNTGAVGDWSETVAITTRSVFIPTREEVKLSPNDRQANDQFGRGLAISGDGNRVFVSAFNVTNNKKGAVYVYLRNGGSWTLEAKLAAATTDTTANYTGLERGMSIATDDTGVRFVIGTVYSKSVLIYRRDGVTWTLEQEITVSTSVALLSVDFSKDASRLAIGEPNSNRVYVYLRTGNVWAIEATIVSDDVNAAGSGFGFNMSLGETGTRLAISAVFTKSDTSGNNSAGAVFIYLRTGTTWAKEAKLVASADDQGTQSYFGASIKMDPTGIRLVVGMSASSVGATRGGAFYVFIRNVATWALEARKTTPAIATGYVLGYCVSINGLGNTIAVSAPTQGVGGFAHIFTRTGTTWDSIASFTSSDINSNDQFGNEVKLATNSSRMAVAAHGSDSGGISDAGGVYVFS